MLTRNTSKAQQKDEAQEPLHYDSTARVLSVTN